MSDEKTEPTREEMVEILAAEILKHGRVEFAERMLRRMFPLTPEEEVRDLVDEAHMMLVSSAPAEIRASMTTIIGYHRWNAVYKKAMSNNDVANAIAAQKQLDRLMGSIH